MNTRTAALLVSALVAGAASAQSTFTDNTGATWTDVSGPASVFPLTLDVSGLAGPIADVNVTLLGLSHTWPDDLDIVLVSPDGTAVVLMSDAGSSTDLVGIDLTFDDAADFVLPDSALSSGTYQPADYATVGESIPGAPEGPYATLLSAFNGGDANGVWSLYAFDDANGDEGSFAGWSLTITAVPAPTGVSALAAAGLLAARRRR